MVILLKDRLMLNNTAARDAELNSCALKAIKEARNIVSPMPPRRGSRRMSNI
jgi:hypothetical protein